MALDLTSEQRETGKANFHQVVGQLAGPNRRDFMKGLLAAGGAVAVSAAAYFGYKKLDGNPVKVGLIGAGDEGGVLVGEHNPEFLEFVAYSDIRPYNQQRIFKGEPTGPRKGFDRIYGKDASKKIKLYENYKDLLADKNVEAVVIALPLHLHAQASIDAMRAGKHVLCEKLMAWNVHQCKDMIRTSQEQDRILTIGHQRHYSLLYAQALEVLNAGVGTGEVALLGGTPGNALSLGWQRCAVDGFADGVELVNPPANEDSTTGDTNWYPPAIPGVFQGLLTTNPEIRGYAYEYADGMWYGLPTYEDLGIPVENLTLALRTDEQNLFCDWAERAEPTYNIWYSAGGNFQSRVGVTAAMMSINGAEIPAEVVVPHVMRQVTEADCDPNRVNEAVSGTSLVPNSDLQLMFG